MRLGADPLAIRSGALNQALDLRLCVIPEGHSESVVGRVQREMFAHHAEADYAQVDASHCILFPACEQRTGWNDQRKHSDQELPHH